MLSRLSESHEFSEMKYRFGPYVVCVLAEPRVSRVAISSGRARYITQPSPHLKGQICILLVEFTPNNSHNM